MSTYETYVSTKLVNYAQVITPTPSLGTFSLKICIDVSLLVLFILSLVGHGQCGLCHQITSATPARESFSVRLLRDC